MALNNLMTVRYEQQQDAEQVRFYWEPDYVSCHLRRNGANVCVSIEEPEEDKPVFEAAFPAVAFAKRLALECRRLQPLCGNRATWGREFPGPEVECLQATTESVERSGSGQCQTASIANEQEGH